MSQILFILAAICFGVGTVDSRIVWSNAGFCLLTIAVFLV
jgi:hypothetical protein